MSGNGGRIPQGARLVKIATELLKKLDGEPGHPGWLEELGLPEEFTDPRLRSIVINFHKLRDAVRNSGLLPSIENSDSLFTINSKLARFLFQNRTALVAFNADCSDFLEAKAHYAGLAEDDPVRAEAIKMAEFAQKITAFCCEPFAETISAPSAAPAHQVEVVTQSIAPSQTSGSSADCVVDIIYQIEGSWITRPIELFRRFGMIERDDLHTSAGFHRFAALNKEKLDYILNPPTTIAGYFDTDADTTEQCVLTAKMEIIKEINRLRLSYLALCKTKPEYAPIYAELALNLEQFNGDLLDEETQNFTYERVTERLQEILEQYQAQLTFRSLWRARQTVGMKNIFSIVLNQRKQEESPFAALVLKVQKFRLEQDSKQTRLLDKIRIAVTEKAQATKAAEVAQSAQTTVTTSENASLLFTLWRCAPDLGITAGLSRLLGLTSTNMASSNPSAERAAPMGQMAPSFWSKSASQLSSRGQTHLPQFLPTVA